MAFAKISTTDTGLRLGLGLLDGSENCMKAGSHRQSQKKKEEGPFQYPSLTLGPPDEANQLATRTESADFNWEASSPSAVSSFSNSSGMKREREFVGEEYEVKVDKIPSSSRVDDVDEDGNPRKKLRLTREQSAVLEDSFKDNTTLNPKQRQELARKLNLRARQVEVWFQNRRARTKVKQTEVEREILKKCCERLREEKERLEKELEELKSVGPFYVEIPAATVSICPACCERICGGREGSSSKAHNLYSSAAC